MSRVTSMRGLGEHVPQGTRPCRWGQPLFLARENRQKRTFWGLFLVKEVCEYFLLDLIRNQANFQLCWNWTFLRIFLEIELLTNKAFWLKAKNATEDWSFKIHLVYNFDLSSTDTRETHGSALSWVSAIMFDFQLNAETSLRPKSKQENFVGHSQ